jgi:pyrimidine-nucleoside phosphorylase
MRSVDLIRGVRDNNPPSASDLAVFVQGIAKGEIPDYQASAFLMAVFFRGLPSELTAAMTLAMRDSGRVIDLSHIKGVKVDKHSTGGVGDKISLPLAPLVAACGVPVPMVSGRGLGHTGGTLDKLESIPGFRVDLSLERFAELVQQHGLCLIGQTSDLAPADKKLYALRDVTGTVESVPLITASILSKKLAEGINALVLDVKVGRGAFMKTVEDARVLANSLVRVGTQAGVQVRALITDMDQPLGRTIGNALEVKESLEILQGKGPADTTELTLALGAEMLVMGKVAKDTTEARAQLQKAITSGAGLKKFRDIVEAQHGDPRVVDDPGKLPASEHKSAVLAREAGVVTDIDPYAVGTAAVRLGAGRARAEDKVDHGVGIVLAKKVGDTVERGEPIAYVHHRGNADAELQAIEAGFRIGEKAPPARPLIVDTLT